MCKLHKPLEIGAGTAQSTAGDADSLRARSTHPVNAEVKYPRFHHLIRHIRVCPSYRDNRVTEYRQGLGMVQYLHPLPRHQPYHSLTVVFPANHAQSAICAGVTSSHRSRTLVHEPSPLSPSAAGHCPDQSTPAHTGARVPAKICQARAVLATRLSMM